ncbi:hypothetical protein [Aquamicrobium sp. LC103]|uniref:hypothetical protein n=1 Tax=Aquamicrobium sp. LC103 TaxID=1120658 RepID=UPI00109CCD7A|nr:hypothetical protein [Aquamicrobium sp. LC103]TKT76748.1 hypothetical protein XW59_014875 [Aquamicrobium sp. LC103]
MSEHAIVGVLHKAQLNYDQLGNRLVDGEHLARLLKGSDILLINGEDAFLSARSPELECLVDLAIENSVPFALINSVFRDYAFFADRLKRAEFLTLRDDRSVDEAKAAGLPAMRCADAALYAAFDPPAPPARPSGTVVADWHRQARGERRLVREVLAKGGAFLPFTGRHTLTEWPALLNLLGQYEYSVCGGSRGILFSVLAGNNVRFLDCDEDEIAQLAIELGLAHRRLEPDMPFEDAGLSAVRDIEQAREILLSWQNDPRLHPLAPLGQAVVSAVTAGKVDGDDEATGNSGVEHLPREKNVSLSRIAADEVVLAVKSKKSPKYIRSLISSLDNSRINQAFELCLQESAFDACLYFIRVLFEKDELHDANSLIVRLLRKKPDLPGGNALAGAIAFHLGDSALAATYYEMADAVGELDGRSLANFARAAGRMGLHHEKSTIFERSIHLRGRTKPMLVELVRSMAAAGNPMEARSLAEEVAAADTSDLAPQQEVDLGNLLTATGSFADGFRLMAAGWRRGSTQFQTVLEQRHVTSAPEEYLFVPEEIGVGSAVLSSCFLDSRETGRPTTLVIDRRLHGIFGRSFPELRTIDMHAFLESDERGVCTDLFTWIGSRATVADIGSKSARLIPDPVKVELVREKYRRRFPGRKLTGFTWFTPNPRSGPSRNIPISEIRRIIDEKPDATWISLQPVLAYAGRAIATFDRPNVFVDTEIDPIGDIEMQIAQIAALDEVRSIDCSAALFAGAIGKSTECYLNYPPIWQWPRMASWHETVNCVPPSSARSPYREDPRTA